MEWMSIFGVLFLMGNRFLFIDCYHQLLGRVRKEKGQVFLARKLSVLRFSMLNFRTQKTIQSEFIVLSPFLPMGFFLNNFGTTIA